jgi:hypothetical protein
MWGEGEGHVWLSQSCGKKIAVEDVGLRVWRLKVKSKLRAADVQDEGGGVRGLAG